MFICYFGYRHESVIDELKDVEAAHAEVAPQESEEEKQGLATEVQRLFEVEKIYLNPRLKLSDVAHMVGIKPHLSQQVFQSGEWQHVL